MSTTRRLWRWRSNPLRRHEDVVEAWVVLTVWVIVALAGTFAALVTARSAEHEFAEQRAHRHAVRAVLLADTPRDTDGRARGTVRWTAPDGTLRSGQTLVDGGLKAGAPVTVWQDGQGRLALSQPTGRTQGHVEASLFGAAAALAVAAPVFGAGAFARARLDRRRMARWDQEWELVGPQWGPKTG
ncbi:Rv1733c family protein [Streptomyces cinerochromogenes]|uniref:Rv1733c family protein n=1 Tax=Streptomyces cinerochromogenes TaxID=66422 RepID=UPI0033A5E361